MCVARVLQTAPVRRSPVLPWPYRDGGPRFHRPGTASVRPDRAPHRSEASTRVKSCINTSSARTAIITARAAHTLSWGGSSTDGLKLQLRQLRQLRQPGRSIAQRTEREYRELQLRRSATPDHGHTHPRRRGHLQLFAQRQHPEQERLRQQLWFQANGCGPHAASSRSCDRRRPRYGAIA